VTDEAGAYGDEGFHGRELQRIEGEAVPIGRPVRYLLAMLSHGYPASGTADETLASFAANVDVGPAFAVYYHDGPGTAYAATEACEFRAVGSEKQDGFCTAVRKLWHVASREAVDRQIPYVFWLEHDFRFLRRFRVRDLARPLGDARVVQTQLMRKPVNVEEHAYGILRGERSIEVDYVTHASYFTTNPSLLRSAFMREYPFPADGKRECEGRFGLSLIEQGFRFAVMGDGTDAWVEHFGTRNGHGY
jgi:hypothetical protein